MFSKGIEPRRCALRFKPPILVLLYLDHGSGKQRRRSMPLRHITKCTNIEEFANDLQNHPRHAVYFKAIPTKQLCTLLKRVKDACAEDDIQQDTEASMEKYAGKNEVKTAALLLSTTETGKAVKQQTDEVTVHPVSSASHTGTFLQDLPPLALFANKQQGTSREEISHLSLDDLLGPLVEEQRLDKHAGTVQDETAPCGREPMHDGPVIISPPEFEYPDEFSSDQESAEDKSLSFNMQLSTNGGGRESMQESETEQHQLHSLSLHIPDIVTGDNSEASGNDGQDLNKVSEEVLAQEKKKMDLLFETHHIKPGATDWEYDKQKEFETPCMESGWDSESSSVQEF